MVKYEDLYKAAKKAGSIRNLSPIRKEWKKKGDSLIGVFKGVGEIESKAFGSTFFSYQFETTDGNVKCIFGAQIDNEVRPFLVPGKIYRFEYLEDKDTGKGNPMKVFSVEEIEPDRISNEELPLPEGYREKD